MTGMESTLITKALSSTFRPHPYPNHRQLLAVKPCGASPTVPSVPTKMFPPRSCPRGILLSSYPTVLPDPILHGSAQIPLCLLRERPQAQPGFPRKCPPAVQSNSLCALPPITGAG